MPTPRPTRLPGVQPSPRLSYLPASPHCLPTTSSGRALHPLVRRRAGFRRLALLGSAWARHSRYGNINPLSIDYACRPRLRSRLTQGGLAWPWKPWSSGGGVSHPSFATHACILTRVASTAGHPAASLATRRSPTHPRAWTTKAWLLRESHNFGGMLEPRYIVGAESLDQ